MLTKTNFEQELLNEIKGLPQSDLARIVKLVHCRVEPIKKIETVIEILIK